MRGLFFNMIHVRSVILLNDILQIHMEGRFFFPLWAHIPNLTCVPALFYFITLITTYFMPGILQSTLQMLIYLILVIAQ